VTATTLQTLFVNKASKKARATIQTGSSRRKQGLQPKNPMPGFAGFVLTPQHINQTSIHPGCGQGLMTTDQQGYMVGLHIGIAKAPVGNL
jgi:hypothetical protein